MRSLAPLLVAATLVASRLDAQDSTRVEVSRREVRVTFPRDTATRWGFADRRDPAYSPYYMWSISVDGMDGPRSISLDAWSEDRTPRWYRSIGKLVASARGGVCAPGMMRIVPCPPPVVEGRVRDGRVVLVLRDSAAIDRLFGMRPAAVSAWWRTPEASGSAGTVRVAYVDPQLPEPDAARRADAAESGRRYVASISSTIRHLAGRDDGYATTFWAAVGDSVPLHVSEYRCRHDVCSGDGRPPLDSAWTVDDTTIAVVSDRRNDDPPQQVVGRIVVSPDWRPVHLVARRPGRTVVRVHGIGSPLDARDNHEPPPRTLSAELVVTRRVARLAIAEPTEPVRAGDVVQLRARALDAHGAEVTGVPVRWEVKGERRHAILSPATPRHTFTEVEPTLVIARLGTFADTLRIDVRARQQR